MITKIMLKSFITNFSLGIIKLLGGLLGNSKTLIADAVHCLSDMSTDIIGIVGSKLAKKEPDKTHPFGHGKIEYVTSIFISLMIIVLGITILKNSFNEQKLDTSFYALIALTLTIIIKLFLCTYLFKKGKETNNTILITNATESKYDVLASSVALFFVCLSVLSKNIKIFAYADIIGSIVISIFTLRVGILLFLTNVKSVIGEIDDDQDSINSINNCILKNRNIDNILRTSILKYGSYKHVFVDLTMNENYNLKKVYLIETKIKNIIKKNNNDVKYVTINIIPTSNK